MLAIRIINEVSVGEGVVGLGTLALAAVTGWLAHRTGQDVVLSREGLDLTRETIEAGDRPFLIGTPTQFTYMPTFDRYEEIPTGSEWTLEVTFENWGRGPAIFDGVSLTDSSGKEWVPSEWEVEMALLPGDKREAGVGLGDDITPPPAGWEATLGLFFRSASGVRYVTRHSVRVEAQNRVSRLDFRRALASSTD